MIWENDSLVQKSTVEFEHQFFDEFNVLKPPKTKPLIESKKDKKKIEFNFDNKFNRLQPNGRALFWDALASRDEVAELNSRFLVFQLPNKTIVFEWFLSTATIESVYSFLYYIMRINDEIDKKPIGIFDPNNRYIPPSQNKISEELKFTRDRRTRKRIRVKWLRF